MDGKCRRRGYRKGSTGFCLALYVCLCKRLANPAKQGEQAGGQRIVDGELQENVKDTACCNLLVCAGSRKSTYPVGIQLSCRPWHLYTSRLPLFCALGL